MAATSMFQRLRTGSKLGAQYDQEGNLIQPHITVVEVSSGKQNHSFDWFILSANFARILYCSCTFFLMELAGTGFRLQNHQVETREDEEQNVKLAEILELLVAAGYFRARIKGLSPFDKVVGGMTWCITTCNFDIDVDLLFQENSTIGQKIALTEKIVSVLPKMKCPHRLEPHQIQGLDFIHIFPVVQWLVKRAIETREEMGDYIRAYSVSQFQKTHSIPEDNDFMQRKEKAIKTVMDVSEEMTRLQQSIENLKIESGDDDGEQKARRNREIAILQRKIDEVPSRAELTQYQKRFIELYGQVAATHKETKQFFTLYNTLDDKKVFLEKEMEKKKQENKMRRDQLNDEYLELLEKQRLYFKTVKDFKEECRKNEMLLSKLRAKGAS
ncbi:UNVERIFIED_CONTAM: hypothetical protein FKN15_055635 [Acipenser sinensis]